MLEWADRKGLHERFISLVKPARCVMDIGPGIRPQTIIPAPQMLVCVEAHDEYIACLRTRFAGTNTVIIRGQVPECLISLPDKCVDTVTMLDFLEHLDREDGLAALRECERIARQQVIVFTPLGFMPQEETGDEDGWGLHGMHWQKHRSGWTPDDFGDRWDVVVCKDFHTVNGQGERLVKPYGALWAVLTLEHVSGPQQPLNVTQEGSEAFSVAAAGLRRRESEVLAREISLRRRERRVRHLERMSRLLRRAHPVSLWRLLSRMVPRGSPSRRGDS